MKKILVLLLLSVSFLFAAINLQTATKKELMSIKGVGSKKADAILKYRKSNILHSADDLKNIRGFGPKLIANAKDDKNKEKKVKNINKSNMSKEQKISKSKKLE